MSAVFEQDFYSFSYGFREGRNAHDALAYLCEQCMTRGIRWIYDADITGFFDNIDRGWLRTFIKRRINDGGILRLIGKWLNAGIMEGEEISYSDKGTPQGGVISPLLANIYLTVRSFQSRVVKVSVGESKYQWVTHVRSNQNTALAPKGNMSNKEIIIY